MPPVPAFYHRPKTLQDVVDQTVNRVLDLLGIELEEGLFARWQGPPQHAGQPREVADHRGTGNGSGQAAGIIAATNGASPPEKRAAGICQH
jgi:hypothetical protein